MKTSHKPFFFEFRKPEGHKTDSGKPSTAGKHHTKPSYLNICKTSRQRPKYDILGSRTKNNPFLMQSSSEHDLLLQSSSRNLRNMQSTDRTAKNMKSSQMSLMGDKYAKNEFSGHGGSSGMSKLIRKQSFENIKLKKASLRKYRCDRILSILEFDEVS